MQLKLPERFTGIIQAQPTSPSELKTLQRSVREKFPEHQDLPKLHITLLHQSFPKQVTASNGLRGDKALKKFFKQDQETIHKALDLLFDPSGKTKYQIPSAQFETVHLGIDEGLGRESSYVVATNTQELRDLRDMILTVAGIDPESIPYTDEERNRIFHVSLTNLTGNGGDSIAYPHRADQVI